MGAVQNRALHVAMHKTTQLSKLSRAIWDPGVLPRPRGHGLPGFCSRGCTRGGRSRGTGSEGTRGLPDPRPSLTGSGSRARPGDRRGVQEGREEAASPSAAQGCRGQRPVGGASSGPPRRARKVQVRDGRGVDLAGPSTRPRSPPGPGALQSETGEEGEPGGRPQRLPWRRWRVFRWRGQRRRRGAGRAKEGLILAPAPPRGRSNERAGVGEGPTFAPTARSDPWRLRREAGRGGAGPSH